MERLTQREGNGHVYIIGCPQFELPEEANKVIQAVADKCADIEEIICEDYDLERLRELVEADRDGRCYTTNVKIGEKIYFPDNEGGVASCRVNGISLPAHGNALIIHRANYPGEYLWTDREGIDWWKTRKAAKDALKGDRNEN